MPSLGWKKIITALSSSFIYLKQNFRTISIVLFIFCSLEGQVVFAETQDWTITTAGNYTYNTNKIEFTGTTAQLKPIYGQITDSVIDILEYETSNSLNASIVNVAGDIYAIAYTGPGNDGFISTIQIGVNGQVGSSIIDSYEYDTSSGLYPDIIRISNNIFAVVYSGSGSDGFVKTITIADDGTITKSVIDILEYDTIYGSQAKIIPISGDIYAIAYRGNGSDGYIATVEISPLGDITNTVLGVYEYNTSQGKSPDIINISGDIYAVTYSGPGSDGWVSTLNISSTGVITNSVISSLEFDKASGSDMYIFPISGDIYGIAYAGDRTDGFLVTLEISSLGVITNTVIDSYEYDTSRGSTPSVQSLGNNIYAIAYQGSGSDGFIKTIEISQAGVIIKLPLDVLEFNTVKASDTEMIHISGEYYAVVYTDTNTDGFVTTVEIGTRYAIDSPTIIPTASFNPVSVASWNNFVETVTKNGGEIYYQLSDDDGVTWQYWNGSSWSSVAGATDYNTASIVNLNISNFSSSAGKIMWKAFLSGDGTQQVVIDNLQIVYSLPDSIAPDAVSDLVTSNSGQSSIRIDWTASGDDGNTGTATTYDIRYSTTNITNDTDFNNATQVTGEPTPSVAGTGESVTITGLVAETTYYFAIKTSDEVLNTSTLSNIAIGTTTATPDTTAPSDVSDLSTAGVSATTIDLGWTASGDDGNTGTATTYDIRYSTTNITNDTDFNNATQVTGEPTPSVAGTGESMTVTGLSPNTTYYFAMKTLDESLNTSLISNVVSNTTTSALDTIAPSVVSDLSASNSTQTTIDLGWTASGDDGNTGTATTYDIRYSISNIANDTDFNNATQVTGEPTPSVAGTGESMTVTGLSTGTTYYFALKTSDEESNVSDLSNIAISSTDTSSISIPTEGGGTSATRISFTGSAFPGSQVKVLIKNDLNSNFRNVPISVYEMSKEGVFSIDYLAFLTGRYFIGLKGVDKTGQETGTLSFNVDFRNQPSLEVRDIIFPPTVIFSDESIGEGKGFNISGYSSPDSEIELKINGIITGNTVSDFSGYYSLDFNADDFEKGTHYVRVQQRKDGKVSSYSFPRTFKISGLKYPKADFNNDNSVNITDWSVFLFRWSSDNAKIRSKIDMDSNGKIDIIDFSIFLKAINI